jgi:hypothetical protein
MGLGLLLLADYAYRSLDLSAHYTDVGVLPRSVYADVFAEVRVAWSGHLLSGELWFQALLFLVGVGGAVALLLGYRTRAATILSWALLVSLHNRQPLVITGGDMILRLLLFWSIFLPLHAVWSVDGRGRRIDLHQRKSSLASLALLIQIGLIYEFSVIFKLLDPAWIELTAVRQAMEVEGVATSLGRHLLGHPELMRLLTAGTIWIELVLPILVFSPWRTNQIRAAIVPAMWIFHLFGIGGTMNLGLLEYVMALAWVPFLPSIFWDRIAKSSSIRTHCDPREDDMSSRSSSAANFFVAVALYLVVVDNLASLDRAGFRNGVGTAYSLPTRALALSQNWRLWSTPLKNRYYVFPATLRDGTRVDLHSGNELDWRKPLKRSRNNHWWKYQLHISHPRRHELRPAYAQFLIRRWNRAHTEDREVSHLMLVMIDASQGNGPIEDMPRKVLYQTSR